MESRSDRSSFEVNCGRCGVTFSVGTKKCVHCGGPTHSSRSRGFEVDTNPNSNVEGEFEVPSGDAHPIVVSGSGGQGDPMFPDSNSDEGEGVEEAPTSIGRSILRSMGGFIWILLLIGFSLVRSCGE